MDSRFFSEGQDPESAKLVHRRKFSMLKLDLPELHDAVRLMGSLSNNTVPMENGIRSMTEPRWKSGRS
jgi:hypothetical protein